MKNLLLLTFVAFLMFSSISCKKNDSTPSTAINTFVFGGKSYNIESVGVAYWGDDLLELVIFSKNGDKTYPYLDIVFKGGSRFELAQGTYNRSVGTELAANEFIAESYQNAELKYKIGTTGTLIISKSGSKYSISIDYDTETKGKTSCKIESELLITDLSNHFTIDNTYYQIESSQISVQANNNAIIYFFSTAGDFMSPRVDLLLSNYVSSKFTAGVYMYALGANSFTGGAYQSTTTSYTFNGGEGEVVTFGNNAYGFYFLPVAQTVKFEIVYFATLSATKKNFNSLPTLTGALHTVKF